MQSAPRDLRHPDNCPRHPRPGQLLTGTGTEPTRPRPPLPVPDTQTMMVERVDCVCPARRGADDAADGRPRCTPCRRSAGGRGSTVWWRPRDSVGSPGAEWETGLPKFAAANTLIPEQYHDLRRVAVDTSERGDHIFCRQRQGANSDADCCPYGVADGCCRRPDRCLARAECRQIRSVH